MSIVISLIVIGLLLWLVGLLPIDDTVKRIIQVVVIVCIILWLLSMLAGYGGSGFIYPPPRR
jgi:uncharacterized membrane protein